MKYTMEELSPCKRKVHVCVEAAEINAAIDAAVALQRKGIALAGFRKGHVPAHLVEKRFMGQLYHDASQDLTNVHINTIMSENSLSPLGAVSTENMTPFKRDTDQEYDLVFEHMPLFELPDYEGLEAEEEKVEVSESEVDAFVARFLESKAKFVPVEGSGPAQDGEYANLDLDIECEGEQVKEQHLQGVDFQVGQKGVLVELDELVKSLKMGETGSKELTFPENFINPQLSGKPGKLIITVHAIKRREVPELDDMFLASIKVASVEDFRASLQKLLFNQKRAMLASESQTKLLDGLIEKLDFAVPQSLYDRCMEENLASLFSKYERIGQTIPSDKLEEIKKGFEPSVIKQVKSLVFLLAVAKKEGLEISEQEIVNALAQVAQQGRQDFNAVYNFYRESGEIFHLRDSLLADKAMRAIYAKAKITVVEKKEEAPAEPAAEAAPAEKPAE